MIIRQPRPAAAVIATAAGSVCIIRATALAPPQLVRVNGPLLGIAFASTRSSAPHGRTWPIASVATKVPSRLDSGDFGAYLAIIRRICVDQPCPARLVVPPG
jgi:hypothetical protein